MTAAQHDGMTTEGKREAKKRKWRCAVAVLGSLLALGCIAFCAFSFLAAGEARKVPEAKAPKAKAATAPTVTPVPATAVPVGSSRSNPIPAGSAAIGGGMNLTVTGIRRPANGEVAAGSMLNRDPEPGHEYVMVYIEATCTLPPEADKQCHLEPYEFELTGSSNLVRKREYVTRVTGVLEDIEFYSGVVVTGGLVFQVAEGESDLILIYEPFWSFLFKNEVFFALQ